MSDIDQADLYALYESDPAPIADFLRWLAASFDLPAGDPPLRVLDVGCGPGRMLAPLSELGWRVTGLEPDPDYAEKAARQAASLRGASARRGGFAEIGDLDGDAAGPYDLIAAINGPYSYLLTYEARRDAIERCARALRPGGVLFLHFSNFWWILRHYRPPPEQRMVLEGVEIVRTAEHEIDYAEGRFTHVDTFTWTGADGAARQLRKTHQMAMVDLVETLRLLREAGFEEIRTFDDYSDREPVRLGGKRVLVAARRRRAPDAD